MICLSLLKVGKSSDKHNKVVYKNSELGLPVKITTFTSMPSNITLEDVNKEKDFANVESVVDVTYDEAGNRLWYSVDNRVRNEKWIEVTLLGIGVFKSQDVDAANPAYELVRQDLVAGAYRDASGKAHFPVLDAQGSVRGYVTKSGLESAYDYYPYGTVVEVSPNAGDDNKRWQSKEFDNEHGKYYFGSRYFDPFFGMWMSPDPAGQFANPYTYGGDPVNFVDPNGEMITAGAVIGAAVVGAIIGGSVASYQCSKYGAGSCTVAVPQGIIVGAASGAAGSAAGGAAASIASIESQTAFGALAGGMAGSGTSYVGNVLFSGQWNSEDFVKSVMLGGASGLLGAGIGTVLNSVGASAIGTVRWFNPIGWITNVPILSDATSSAVSSMIMAKITGDDIASAAAMGAATGALFSVTNAIGLLNYIDRDPEGFAREFYGDDVVLMHENELKKDGFSEDNSAVALASQRPGTVMGAFANGQNWLSKLIAIISGGGPLSHVRGSDINGTVLESNNNGVGIVDYKDPSYETTSGNSSVQTPSRLTLVTTKYKSGLTGKTVEQLRNVGYFEGGLCTGATHKIISTYRGGAPNALMPYAIRKSYAVNVW